MIGGGYSQLLKSECGFECNGQYYKGENEEVASTLQARAGGGATDMYIRQRKWKGK